MKIKYFIIKYLINLLGGVPVSFSFTGDKGKRDIHATSFLHYKPFSEEFIIDWTNKEVELFGKKRF